ncbi:MAG: formyltetrahydrofolate deformylase [Nocardioidaceae bacterium]|nr:formyltetrahydrofolate deformylase [Nocardioidaceae bacterium]NUS53161.1 formyltetrahydrofolate deformylase [Nocardioidaceae bacterium]
MSDQYVVTLACPDRPGIVHAVAGFLVDLGGNILESQQHDDLAEHRFFMRVRFDAPGTDLDGLRAAFTPVAERFDMAWELWDAAAPYRTLILVSKFAHCLNDLLFRWSNQHLQIDAVGVVSNHPDLEPMAASYGVPFHHVPVTPDTKPEAEARLLGLVDELDVDLVVLARYMQVLSNDTCRQLEGKAINIHHSFLPSFKGARPYHQAFDRGVKLVGATAHYVTADLDEGPIIEQDVMRVDHRYDASELAAAGRDVESQVLSRAVRWHTESRVIVNGHKTVVFR